MKHGYLGAFLGAILGSLLTLLSITTGVLPVDKLVEVRGPEAGMIPDQNAEVRTIEIVGDAGDIYTSVVQKAMPSVVGITTTSVTQDRLLGTQQRSGVGTGVIVDSTGYILTNSHVVENGNVSQVNVILSTGDVEVAEVLWHEEELDLAVIRVNRTGLPVADLGSSDTVQVGQIAIAIGNPMGLQFERSVTQGIISGLNRSIQFEDGTVIEELIQTDASINQGNSGGPLLNTKGEVIGINSAKVKTGEGLGFAIPIDVAKPIVDEFKEHGEFQRVYIGLRARVMDTTYYEYMKGLSNVSSIPRGIYVDEVVQDSPAQKADIRPGDFIVRMDGQTIDSKSKLTRILYKRRPGDIIEVEFIRDGVLTTASVLF